MIQRFKIPIVLCIIFLSTSLQAQLSENLFLSSGTLDFSNTPEEIGNGIKSGSLKLQSFDDKISFIAHFDEIPSQSTRKILQKHDVRLHGYIPNNSWWVVAPRAIDFSILEQAGVDFIHLPDPSQKISDGLTMENWPEHAKKNGKIMLAVSVLYQSFENAKIENALRSFLKDSRILSRNGSGQYEITIRPDDLTELASQPFVFYVAPIEPPIEMERLTYKTNARSNWLSDHPTEPNYIGNGVTLGVREGKVDGSDIDFTGRLDNSMHTGNISGHATGVSDIMAGAGNYDPTDIGMAYGADILSMNNTFAAFYNQGASAVNNSYGWGCGLRTYGTSASNNDFLVRTNEDFMIVYSAGNEGNNDCGYGAGSPWGTISGSPKMAKNVIAVAATNIYDERMGFSSVGPATDGRIKPDMSAVGPGGTSHACPGVVGVFGQLIEYYKDQNNDQHPNTSLLKATLQNTAVDLGNAGPDFKYGYGRINTRRAKNLLDDGHWLEDNISNGSAKTHNLSVPAGTKELRVMLYWADKEATPGVSKALVNDLDFDVQAPSGNFYLPWVLDHRPFVNLLDAPAQRKVDTLNNMEQVTIDNPAAGNYTLTVEGSNVPEGPQDYFIVYEFVKDTVQLTYPIGGESFVPFTNEVIRWDSYGNSGTFDIEFSADSGNAWYTVASGISSEQRYYQWTVPDSVTGHAMIRINRGGMQSEVAATFSIIPIPQNLDVLWACADSMMLYWDTLPEAQEYEISQLGQKYMDSIGRTADDHFLVKNIDPNQEHWFSIRSLGRKNASGRRAIAMNKAPGNYSCVMHDAAIVEVISPQPGSYPDCFAMDNHPLRVRLMNRGVQTLTDIPVKYVINGGSVQSDTFFNSLESAHRVGFTLEDSVGLNLGVNTIEVWTDLPSDGNRANDTMAIQVEVYSGGFANLPYEQDFENFTLCSTAWGCSSVICDLIENWKNQPNVAVDSMDWRTDNNGTASSNTGPSGDYPSGSGKYLYLESSGNGGSGCWNQDAHLISPCVDLSNTKNPKLSFWYHMYGSSIGSLHVDAFVDGKWQTDIMQPIVGDQGNDWLNSEVDLNAYKEKTILLRFRGITGNGYRSDMALDLINITTQPKAGFEAAPLMVCTGQVVNFTNNSFYADSVKWQVSPGAFDYVNGTHQNSSAPSIRINDTGTFTIQQVVFNEFGSDTLTQTIFAGPYPIKISTSDSANMVCHSDTLDIFANSNVNYYEFYVNNVLKQSGPSDTFSYPFTQSSLVKVRGKVNDSCFTSYAQLTVFVSNLKSSVQATDSVSCFGVNDGFARISAKTGIQPYEIQWSDNGSGFERNDLSAGSFSYTVTDAAGCEEMGSLEIGGPPQIFPNAYSTSATCPGGMDGTAGVNPAGGQGGLQVQWENGIDTTVLSGLSGGSYRFTITDNEGCAVTDSIFVDQPKPISPNASVQNVSCYGLNDGAVEIVPTGGTSGYSYHWGTGATDSSIAGLAAGWYRITITDANGCEKVDSVEISQPNLLEAEIIEETEFNCEGGIGTLKAEVNGGTAPFSYQWNNGADTQEITGLSSAIYVVTITDRNNCTAVDSFELNLPGGLSTSIAAENICPGMNAGLALVDVAGGEGPYSYSWSDGQTGDTAFGLAAGFYTITVTDQNQCTKADTVIIESSANLRFDSIRTDAVSCFGGDDGNIHVYPNGGLPAYSFEWSTGSNAAEVNNLIAGNYNVTLTDDRGCEIDTSITLSQPDQLGYGFISKVDSICPGSSDGKLEVEANGGTPGYDYAWSNGDGDSLVTGLSIGDYILNITDGNGCNFSDTIEINEYKVDAAQLNPSNDTSICEGENIALSASRDFEKYLWSNGDTSQVITITSAGEYSLEARDENGCLAMSDTIEISILPAPQTAPIIGLDTTFLNTGTMYQTQDHNGSSFEWTATNGSILNGQGTAQVEVNWQNTGLQTISVVETNDEGCRGDSIQKSVMVLNSSGIESMGLIDVNFYPNPTTGEVKLELELQTAQALEIDVVNQLGQTVYSESRSDNLVEHVVLLQLHHLPKGWYVVKFRGDQYQGERLLLIQ